MTDLSASEARLVAALDRLGAAIDHGRRRLAHPPTATPSPAIAGEVEAHLAAARADNRRLSDEVAALHDRQGATLSALQARLSEAHERLAGLGQQSARLASANDGLAAANRALIEATGDWPSHGAATTIGALEAEIEALRAARAAEISQMGEILDALDRLIGTPARSQAEAEPPRMTRRTNPRRHTEDMPALPGLADPVSGPAASRELIAERDLPPPEDGPDFSMDSEEKEPR